jgi:flavin-dependent dehydrogenase
MELVESLAPRYDALVVGARCAGAATAMLLARSGLRVLAIERSPEGSDALSTHALMRGGVLQLARWGLLGEIVAAGTPAIRATTFHYGDETLAIPIKARDGVDALRAPRRTVLDALLVQAAREAGARVVHGMRATTLVRDGAGRVRGAAVADREGAVATVEAGIVIGADGLRSVVAETVGAELLETGRHASATIYRYWPGLELDGYHWYYRPGVAAGAIPTNGGETCLFVAVNEERFRAERAEGLGAMFPRLLAEAAPDLAAALGGSTPPSPLRAFAGERGFLRRAWGPGWALGGDAGYFRDPITSHGITDALRDAELLARAVARGGDSALAEYQDARDGLVLEYMRLSDGVAAFDWTLDQVREQHRLLAKEMAREVEAIRAWDEQSAEAATGAGRR